MAFYGVILMLVKRGTDMYSYGGLMKEPADRRAVEPEYMGVDNAEILSGLSRWTWRAWAYSGKVASVKVGRRLLIPVTEIRRVMAEGTRPRVVAE
jgi:hypothetical protein